jgi:phospholipid/cholesterol/gamma-HCH transport system ATP-binding protein
MPDASALAVQFDHVTFAFDDNVVLRDVSFSVPKGGMTIVLGASGAGKSVVLKLILGLLRPDGGAITVNGTRVDTLTESALLRMRSDIGMVFQEHALFDSLTVEENVGYRLYEETSLPLADVRARVEEVLASVGLSEFISRMPSELSGGQRRRVGIARAMASRPNLLLLDDPTTGLDPIIASSVDDEIVKLRDLERVTSVLVTHQIRDAFYIGSREARRVDGRTEFEEGDLRAAPHARFLVLHDGRIVFEGNGGELLASKDAYLEEFMFMTLPPW